MEAIGADLRFDADGRQAIHADPDDMRPLDPVHGAAGDACVGETWGR